jgi:hypothetical protein
MEGSVSKITRDWHTLAPRTFKPHLAVSNGVIVEPCHVKVLFQYACYASDFVLLEFLMQEKHVTNQDLFAQQMCFAFESENFGLFIWFHNKKVRMDKSQQELCWYRAFKDDNVQLKTEYLEMVGIPYPRFETMLANATYYVEADAIKVLVNKYGMSLSSIDNFWRFPVDLDIFKMAIAHKVRPNLIYVNLADAIRKGAADIVRYVYDNTEIAQDAHETNVYVMGALKYSQPKIADLILARTDNVAPKLLIWRDLSMPVIEDEEMQRWYKNM